MKQYVFFFLIISIVMLSVIIIGFIFIITILVFFMIRQEQKFKRILKKSSKDKDKIDIKNDKKLKESDKI